MNTRTITGTIVRPSGAAWSAATLTFKLRARFVVDADTVLPDRVTATTDEDGAFSVALAVPDTGTASYEFTAPVGGSAVFYLEAGAPIELAVLLSARGVSVSPDAVAVEAGLRAAADAALQAQIDAGGGGGGAVASVNGQTGVVVLDATDVGADASGTAAGLVASEAATRAAADTTNATALSTHVADTANPHAVTAAQVGAYTSGAVDTLLAAKQPLDSDLTAIAALTTATYGRALLALADAAALRTAAALGTAATANSTDFVAAASVTGGGVLATGGFTLTVPSTGTAALLGVANSFTAAQSVALTDAATAAASTLLTLGHNSSGTPAANFSGLLLWQLQSASTANRNAASLEAIWTTATDASRTANLVAKVAANGVMTERFRVHDQGVNTRWLSEDSSSIFIPGGTPIRSNNTTLLRAGNAGSVMVDMASNAWGDAIVQPIFIINGTNQNATSAGYGTGMKILLKSSTTASRDAAAFTAEWATATDASRKARIKLQAYDTAVREVLRGEASGSAPMIGFLGASAAAQQTGGAATASGSYTATEQGMLQKAYDALRTFGLLS